MMDRRDSLSGADGDPRGQRLDGLDALRGVALVAMAIYHFVWDLDFFGYIPAGTATTGGFALFARCIAASFLVLVGVSLWLAARGGLDRRRFVLRLARIGAAAGLISLATWFATPQTWIHFGILHHIAVASVLALVFLRLPWPVAALAAVGAFAAPAFLGGAAAWMEAPWASVLGLDPAPAPSNDFVPLLPWFGFVLAGLACAPVIAATGALGMRAPRFLGVLGRHSLAFYLVHQPVLIGLVWVAAQIVPPAAPSFADQCQAACIASPASGGDPAACTAYCGCFADALTARGLDPDTLEADAGDLDSIAGRCSAAMPSPPLPRPAQP